MNKIILIIGLLFTTQSYAYNCPESTDLSDPSSRLRCVYKIISHYKEVLEKDIVALWQLRKRNVTNNPVYTNKSDQIGRGYVDPNVEKLFMFQQLIDKHENTGVYQRPPDCPSSSD